MIYIKEFSKEIAKGLSKKISEGIIKVIGGCLHKEIEFLKRIYIEMLQGIVEWILIDIVNRKKNLINLIFQRKSNDICKTISIKILKKSWNPTRKEILELILKQNV